MPTENNASPPIPTAVSELDILNTALTLAEDKGWDNIRLYQVADQLNISLEEIRLYFTDLNGVANAWFRQAQLKMISTPDDKIINQPAWHRLYLTMLKWLDHVSEHHNITAQILRTKLHPPHVHHWAPMVFDLSTLIHWWLDASRIASVGRQRQIAEIGLTAIFLSTLVYWARDRSSGQIKTKALLKRRLKQADRVMGKCSRRLFWNTAL
ncbi:MAG: hypothetical protein OQK24_06435 [Magnetovibrio sp.]|nr:hypothetical protein [Magnetovibrio sp.]